MSDALEAARNLAHELEPGLLALELRLRALRGKGVLDEELLACLAEVESLRSLSRDYLFLSGLPAELEAGPFSLAPVLETLSKRFAPIAETRRVALEISLQDVRANGDPRATERVLSNLISNAISFSPERGAIAVRARSMGASVEVEVEDHGPGIPLADQERVFAPFVRLDRERPGAGLGLPLARSLAEAQRGTLTLSSEPGRGARFVLTLPAA